MANRSIFAPALSLSPPFPRWNVGARRALFININSPGRNLAITQEYGDN